MERATAITRLSIGQFAAESGLTHKALRLYAAMGLLAPAHVDPWTGYRQYGREQLPAARLIKLMREMEMPLGDIRRVLAAEQDEAEALVLAYEQDFAARLVAVRDGRRRLIETFRQEEHPMSLPVEVRELEKQQIVSIQGHVLVSDLDAFIDRSLQRLKTFVEAQGGRASGPPLGLYHGQVNQQDDGPIEVCLPAQGAFKAEGDIGIRELPGGRAAVVVAEGDYSSFPKILEAYDAGYDWLQSNGHQPLESPREVWVGSPQSEGPFEIMWRFA